MPVTAPTILTAPMITDPGIYDLTHEQYHADPVPGGSLSSTGARKLTPPDGSPARFFYDSTHPTHKREFDFGQLAHNELLGVGPELVFIDFDDYKKKDARIQRDEAYAAGKVPVLPHEMDIVYDMMMAIKAHPWAGTLLAKGAGKAEPSFFWRDAGIMKRSRPDYISYRRHPKTGQLIIVEYKTTPSAEKNKFTKHAYDLGYHQQGAWICDAARGVGLVASDENPMFLFVAQEKKQPYIVNVIQLGGTAQMWGRALNEMAVELYKECRATGVWPGYSSDIEEMPETPVYLTRTYEDYLG